MDIREMTDEQLTQLNQHKSTTKDMNTETKTPKTRKQTRDRRTFPPITQLLDVSEEEADAAFNSVVPRTPLSKQLYALEVGVPKKIDGEFTRVKTAVRGFEKKYGAKFLIAKSPADSLPIVKRLAPTLPVTTEGIENIE